MALAEIKRDVRYKVESIMGIFDYIDDQIAEIEFRVEQTQKRLDVTIALLRSLREEFRKKGEYELADRIRENLELIGVTFEDPKTKQSPV